MENTEKTPFDTAGNIISVQHYSSSAGELILGSIDGRLCLCDWLHSRHRASTDAKIQKSLSAVYREQPSETILLAARQLDEYFARQRTRFDIPLLFTGTDFQRTVWNELLNIPYGTTISYGCLARRIGMPTHVRATANANGANPISIFAPCHRVIGSTGSLTGYGGGLSAKRILLELESGAIPLL